MDIIDQGSERGRLRPVRRAQHAAGAGRMRTVPGQIRSAMSINLREQMPDTYAFIEACREAFGKDAVNPMIKLGMEGAHTFHASENGIEVGTAMPSFEDSPGITLDKMVLQCDRVEIGKPRRN